MFSITAGIERKHLYTATISLVGIEGVVQVLMLNFSELCLCLFNSKISFNTYALATFAVQNCVVKL